MKRALELSIPRRQIANFMCAAAVLILLMAAQVHAFAQQPARGATSASQSEAHPRTPELLREFNTSLVTLTKAVMPAVVQIVVTSYGPVEGGSGSHDDSVALFARQHDIGSGVVVDPNGYIMTNAHVIEGAQRIRVILPGAQDTENLGARKVFDAKLVGADKGIDLALLKVEAHDLAALRLAATRAVNPGELVLAVGSPEGLESSVTMGVVSSVARQPDPNAPAVYIQTDAPINPGNSGGPLIDTDGYVIGLNTMILSESGGSEGLGFAIPAPTVQFVYDSLRKYGHVHRTEIRASAQEITPELAEGLGLAQDWGVILSDVDPDGPAAAVGLKAGDVAVSVDGTRITGIPQFVAALYRHSPEKSVMLNVLRGTQRVSLVVPALPTDDKADDLSDLIAPEDLINRLGVFVHDLDDEARGVVDDNRRIAGGVLVVAQSLELNSYTSGLRAGDILHALNKQPIVSVRQLKSMLRNIRPGQAVVLQVERQGKLQYVAFEWGD